MPREYVILCLRITMQALLHSKRTCRAFLRQRERERRFCRLLTVEKSKSLNYIAVHIATGRKDVYRRDHNSLFSILSLSFEFEIVFRLLSKDRVWNDLKLLRNRPKYMTKAVLCISSKRSNRLLAKYFAPLKVVEGDSVHLPCSVQQLGSYLVVWHHNSR